MRTRTRSPFRQPPNTQEAYKKLSKDIWNPTDRPVFSDSRCLVRVRSDITSRASDAMNFCATVGSRPSSDNKIDLG
jgi:hypothetical protein